jgi:hypothetical protein
MRNPMIQAVASVLAVLAGPLAAQRVTVHDSAGIPIVQSPSIADVPVNLTLAADPEVVIGGADASPADELNEKVSYPFALRLSPTRFLVAEGGIDERHAGFDRGEGVEPCPKNAAEGRNLTAGARHGRFADELSLRMGSPEGSVEPAQTRGLFRCGDDGIRRPFVAAGTRPRPFRG